VILFQGGGYIILSPRRIFARNKVAGGELISGENPPGAIFRPAEIFRLTGYRFNVTERVRLDQMGHRDVDPQSAFTWNFLYNI